LLPEFLDDYVAEDNLVRVIDVFVDELDLRALGCEGVVPEATGRPAYHPATLAASSRSDNAGALTEHLRWSTPISSARDPCSTSRMRRGCVSLCGAETSA
jgi:hypothetical protein